MTGEEGRIAAVASEIEKSNQAERLRGLKEGLEQYPDMEITAVLERGESIIALKDQITQLLDQNPQIDGLFCIEGYSSRAISLIMEEHPESYTQMHKVVFDLNDDTSQALQNGYVDIVLEQRPQTMGTEAVRVLYEHCNQVVEGGSMEREKDVLLEPEIITAWDESVTEPYISGELSWHVY